MKTALRIVIIAAILVINLLYTYLLTDFHVEWTVFFICTLFGILGICLMFLGIHYDRHIAMPFMLGIFGTLAMAMFVWYCFRTVGKYDLMGHGQLAQVLVGLFYAFMGSLLSLPLAAVNTVGLLLYRWILRSERDNPEEPPAA